MKTTKEMIEVMQAYLDGKQIQTRVLQDEYKDESLWAPFIELNGWNWEAFDYRIKPEEKKPEYRPYKDTCEMIADFYKRINSGKASYSMPLIWIKYKGTLHIKALIVAYDDDMVWFGVDNEGHELDELMKNYTYLDGSPCGKKVE